MRRWVAKVGEHSVSVHCPGTPRLRHDRGTECAVEALGDRSAWPDLETILAHAREELDAPAGARLDVVLARPLVTVRCIPLPRLSAVDVRRLLASNAASLFPWSEPVVSDFGRRRGGRRRDPAHTLVASAPARVVEAVAAAVSAAAWSLGEVVPEPALVADGVRRAVARPGSGRTAVIAVREPVAEIIVFDGDRPIAFVPLAATPGGAPDEIAESVRAALQALITSGGPVSRALVVDGTSATGGAEYAFPKEGRSAPLTDTAVSIRAGTPYPAGRRIPASFRTSLVPAGVRGTRIVRDRRRALSVGAVALLLFAASWAVHVAGLERELTRLTTAREEGRDAVERALALRADVLGLREARERFDATINGGSSRTHLLAELAMWLPDDAYLERLTLLRERLTLVGRTPHEDLSSRLPGEGRITVLSIATTAPVGGGEASMFELEARAFDVFEDASGSAPGRSR